MIKGKIAIIIDSIVLSFIIFLLMFFWINKIIKIYTLSLFVSISFGLLIFIIILINSLNKRAKNKIKNAELKLFKITKNTLKYLTIKENQNYFEELLNIKFIGNNLYFNEKSMFYINIYNELNCYDFLIANNTYQQTEKKIPLSFICDKPTNEFLELIKNSPINYNVYTFEELFKIIKEKEIYPKNNESLKINNKSTFFKNIKKYLTNIFIKIKFKDTFFSGISLVILSIFVPYSMYYLIIGSILLILSFFSIFFKSTKNNKINENKTSLDNLFN